MNVRVPIAIALVLGLTAALCGEAPVPASAGECSGMLHYEYDGGQCIDKSGSTSDAMSHMWDESYRANRAILDRSRMFGMGGTTGVRVPQIRIPTPAEQKAIATTFAVRLKQPSDEASRFVERLGLRDARRRHDTKMFLLDGLREFDDFGARNGYGRRNVSGARAFFLRTAYFVYDGDHVADATAAAVLNGLLTATMAMHTSIPSASDVYKRHLYDRYVINAIALQTGWSVGTQNHQTRVLANARSAARRLIAADTGFDPATTRIDQLPCAVSPLPGVSCDQIIRWFRSG